MIPRHRELIFFLLTSPKCDLGEVEKAMFQGLACQFELIFGLFTVPKCDLVLVEKLMFYDTHNTYFRPLLQLKM